jgi:hypothetical protein
MLNAIQLSVDSRSQYSISVPHRINHEFPVIAFRPKSSQNASEPGKLFIGRLSYFPRGARAIWTGTKRTGESTSDIWPRGQLLLRVSCETITAGPEDLRTI